MLLCFGVLAQAGKDFNLLCSTIRNSNPFLKSFSISRQILQDKVLALHTKEFLGYHTTFRGLQSRERASKQEPGGSSFDDESTCDRFGDCRVVE